MPQPQRGGMLKLCRRFAVWATASAAASRGARLRFCPLAVGAGGGPAHEYLFSVEIFHKHADTLTLSAFGLIREDFDLGSNRQAGLCDAVPEEINRRSAFDAPVGHFAVRA